MKRCKKCGAVIVHDGNFCPKCGSNDFIYEDAPNQNSKMKPKENRTRANSEAESFNEKKGGNKTPIVTFIIVLIAVLGIGAYILLSKNDNKNNSDSAMNSDIQYQDEIVSDESNDGIADVVEEIAIEQNTVNEKEEVEGREGGEQVTWYDLTELSSDAPAFYGIWCAATKNKDEAIIVAKKIVDVGISGLVLDSENWSDLAGNNMYIVSAGAYDTESEANAVLLQVKEHYPNAYVKYSGTYKEVSESTNEYTNIESLITLATTREITERDLIGYSSFELSAARNGIYAVHGYIFQTQQWNDFYANFTWYVPDESFKQEQVTPLENKNAGTIRAYEEKTFGGVFTFN